MTHPSRRRQGGGAGRCGFSLVEVLVALLVFGIAVALLIPTFSFFTRANTQQEARSGAVRAAEQVFDELRAADFTRTPPWPSGAAPTSSSRTIANGLGSFTVRYSYCRVGSADCLSTTTARHLRAQVSSEGRVIYELETVVTRFD